MDGLGGDGLGRGHADALDHCNRATTSHYVQRISVNRDLYSEGIAERLKRKTEEKSVR